MAAGAVEIVEHAEQLGDDRGLGPIGGELLVAQGPLAVVGEVGLHPLQVGGQFGDLGLRLLATSRAASGAGPLGAGPVACSRT